MKTKLLLFIGFLVFGVVLYANSLDNSFQYDDSEYIIRNEGIRQLSNIPNLWKGVPPSAEDSPGVNTHYRPVVFTTYLLNYSAGGLNPRGYHAVNLLIHILTAFLVVLVMERLTRRLMVGGLSGFIFLVHPFNSEAVNYVTARSSQLYALFYLLAFYAYMRYRPYSFSSENNLRSPSPCPPPVKGGGAYLWLGLFLISFALSILSKELAVTLPVTIFLYEWLLGPATRLHNRLRGLWLPAVFAIAVVVSFLAIRKILRGGAFQVDMWNNLLSQLATQSVVLVRTLKMILWPSGLTIDHRVEVYKSFANWPVAGAVIVLVVFFGLILWWGRSTIFRKRVYAFLLAWFFVVLSPLVLLHLHEILQENRAYLAVVGIAGIGGTCLVSLLDRAKSRGEVFSKGTWTGIVFLVLIYGALTIQRNMVWKDELSLWTDVVNKNPYSALALDNLGVAYERAGQLDRANEFYHKALEINPYNSIAALNLGDVATKQGRLEEAAGWYMRAVRLSPQFVKAYYNLGNVFERQNKWEEAVRAYRQVVKLSPKNFTGRHHLADALLHEGKPDEAVREYETLINMPVRDQTLLAEVRASLENIRQRSQEGK